MRFGLQCSCWAFTTIVFTEPPPSHRHLVAPSRVSVRLDSCSLAVVQSSGTDTSRAVAVLVTSERVDVRIRSAMQQQQRPTQLQQQQQQQVTWVKLSKASVEEWRSNSTSAQKRQPAPPSLLWFAEQLRSSGASGTHILEPLDGRVRYAFQSANISSTGVPGLGNNPVSSPIAQQMEVVLLCPARLVLTPSVMEGAALVAVKIHHLAKCSLSAPHVALLLPGAPTRSSKGWYCWFCVCEQCLTLFFFPLSHHDNNPSAACSQNPGEVGGSVAVDGLHVSCERQSSEAAPATAADQTAPVTPRPGRAAQQQHLVSANVALSWQTLSAWLGVRPGVGRAAFQTADGGTVRMCGLLAADGTSRHTDKVSLCFQLELSIPPVALSY